MDFPTKEELIASQKEIEDIRAYLGVDSLNYLSMEAMLNAMPKDNGQSYCTACFSGDYPIDIEEAQLKERNEG
jgi:amidophosphoribosyltransferase